MVIRVRFKVFATMMVGRDPRLYGLKKCFLAHFGLKEGSKWRQHDPHGRVASVRRRPRGVARQRKVSASHAERPA